MLKCERAATQIAWLHRNIKKNARTIYPTPKKRQQQKSNEKEEFQ